MPVPTIVSAIVSSIVGAFVEEAAVTAASTSTPPVQAACVGVARKLPVNATVGKLSAMTIDSAVISDQTFVTSPVLQIRNAQNLTMIRSNVQDAVPVCYQLDAFGAVWRIWLLSADEIALLPGASSVTASSSTTVSTTASP